MLQAWIAWDPFGGTAGPPPGYDVSFQDTDRTEVDLQRADTLTQALDLARTRTDWIMVRPRWDEQRYYWAGEGPIPDGGWNQHEGVLRLQVPRADAPSRAPWPDRPGRHSREFQVTFDAHDPRALSSFWRAALGYVHPPPPGVDLLPDADPLAAWDEFLAGLGVPPDQRNTRSALEDPDGYGPRLFFQQVPEGKTAKNRVHLDVRAAPGLEGAARMAALETECQRLVALGATRVRRADPAPMTAGYIVMTDPEGNEFCLD